MPGLAAEEPSRDVREVVVWRSVLPSFQFPLPFTPSLETPSFPYIASWITADWYWWTDALAAATSTLSVDAQKRAEKDAHKKALKAEAAEQKHLQTIASSKVTIKRVERNKRKFVTTVTGLEAFGLENKKVAKDLGKKFATGSSVTKVPSGGEEIVVQGDVSEEIEEFLLEKYPVIPEDNIELVEDKKKKGAGAGW
jgi:density-regulated protein